MQNIMLVIEVVAIVITIVSFLVAVLAIIGAFRLAVIGRLSEGLNRYCDWAVAQHPEMNDLMAVVIKLPALWTMLIVIGAWFLVNREKLEALNG